MVACLATINILLNAEFEGGVTFFDCLIDNGHHGESLLHHPEYPPGMPWPIKRRNDMQVLHPRHPESVKYLWCVFFTSSSGPTINTQRSFFLKDMGQ
jgi:hypothetical protein